jgi:hypothetical protein
MLTRDHNTIHLAQPGTSTAVPRTVLVKSSTKTPPSGR